jgi:hypothetical protein
MESARGKVFEEMNEAVFNRKSTSTRTAISGTDGKRYPRQRFLKM